MTRQTTAAADTPRNDSADGEYIRSHYGVPAEIGRHVHFRHYDRRGVIVGFAGPYIGVLLYGESEPVRLHPTWEVEYLELRPATPAGDGYTRQRDDRLLVAPGAAEPPENEWYLVGAFSDGVGVFAPIELDVRVIWPATPTKQAGAAAAVAEAIQRSDYADLIPLEFLGAVAGLAAAAARGPHAEEAAAVIDALAENAKAHHYKAACRRAAAAVRDLGKRGTDEC